jgi:hypothetical protein
MVYKYSLKGVPGIGATRIALADDDEGGVEVFVYEGSLSYDDILSNLLTLTKKAKLFTDL